MLPVALMDARNSQFLQRTATNSSGSLQLKSPVSLGAGDFGLYTLAPLGLALLVLALLVLVGVLRLPWRLSAGGVVAEVCLGGCLLGECLPRRVFSRRELASEGVLRLPWRLSAWRSCEVLACDYDLVRQGRGLPYKTGSVKDLVRQTRFSRTNWIRRRISLAQ